MSEAPSSQRAEDRIIVLDSSSLHGISTRLVGTAIADGYAIFGDEGLAAFQAAQGAIDPDRWEDGRFFAIISTDTHVRCLTDPMGQDTLFYYDSPHGWIVSNSFYELVRRAKALGRTLTLSMAVLGGFFVHNGTSFGAQLLSNRTPFDEVKMLPIGCEIHIAKHTGKLDIVRRHPGDWLLKDPGERYEDLIERYVLKTTSRLKAIVESKRFDIFCDLSGGHDSRAVLGMLQRACGDLREITVFSASNRGDDFASASLVSEEYKFPLEADASFRHRASEAEVYALWKQSSLGVYLPVYAGSPYEQDALLRFHGGNFLSKEFGELAPADRAIRMDRWGPKNLRSAVADVFLSSFADLDLSRDHPFASHVHYFNFRGRLHYGRNWAHIGRTPQLTPLISQHLARAGFRLTPHDYNINRLSLDLLMALDNRLAAIPFDLPQKNFALDARRRSPFWSKPLSFEPHQLPSFTLYAGPRLAPSNDDQSKLEISGEEKSLKQLLRSSLEEWRDAAMATGIFSESYAEQASASLTEPGPLHMRGRRAAHMIFAGELAAMATR